MKRHPILKTILALDPGGTSTSHLVLAEDHEMEVHALPLGVWQAWRGKTALRLLCHLEVHHHARNSAETIRRTVSHLEAAGMLARDESGTLRTTGSRTCRLRPLPAQ